MSGVEFGVAVAAQNAVPLLTKIKEQVVYLYNYHNNLETLRSAKIPLDAMRADAEALSAEIDREGKNVNNVVELWRSDAKELDEKAVTIISRNNISRLNVWSRFFTSKRAWKLAQDINGKVQSAPFFGMTITPQIAEGDKFNLQGYMDFKSRETIINGVLDALRKDDVRICSICGMGGAGKTMLTKKLIQAVGRHGLFDKVAMVTVTEYPNFEKIQKEIIDLLGLKFEEDTMKGRAKKLNKWLSNNKTLLVLDDVWWHIGNEDFENIGIPLEAKGCKIFVTSRNLDECAKMKSNPNIPLKDLEDEEAWKLFIQNAGKCVEDTARKIVAECKGLPIAIVTIATALNDKPQGEWNDTLKKLQEPNLKNMSDMEKVYLKIQVSYDLLKDLEAQSCLLLCSLFPEDYNVPVEKLVFFAKSLELFNGVATLGEVRNRVDSIVHKLKRWFLLLEGKKEGCVKLHDIIRSFAKWISSKDENPCSVKCMEKMEKGPENYKYKKGDAFSFVCKRIQDRPVVLRYPNHKLLHFEVSSTGIPYGFSEDREELRAVDLQLGSPSLSLTIPPKLRTLLIKGKKHHRYVDEMLMSNFKKMCSEADHDLKNLEIFSLSWMRLSEFPAEIRLMSNLRCLRFLNVPLSHIPPGVLSKLVKLEELELSPEFKDWGLKEEGGRRVNASLDEIACLPLNSITIGLRNRSVLAENTIKSVTRFRIYIECKSFRKEFNFDSNVLVVKNVDACYALANWFSGLLSQCHKLHLKRVNLKFIMSQQLRENNCYQCEFFSQLKAMKIERMGALEEILDGPFSSNVEQPCFENLTMIMIKKCPKLKRAFPLSVVQEFKHLESIKLSICEELEEIFYKGPADTGNQVIILPQLKLFHVVGAPNLRVIYNGHHAIKFPLLEDLVIHKCNNLEGLSYGPLDAPRIKKLELIEAGHLKNIPTCLEQENGTLQCKELMVVKCREMKHFVDATKSPYLPKTFFFGLEDLSVLQMDSLEEIWHGPYFSKIHAECFSNLTAVNIFGCRNMKHLFPLPVATAMRQLERMKIESCEEIEEIFYKIQAGDGNQEASNVQLNASTVETTTTLQKSNDKASAFFCPSPTSSIPSLLKRKRKKRKHHPAHQIIEENIEKVDETEGDTVIVFPQLRELCLSGAPKLRVVCNGNLAIECPSLQELRIDGCDNIECLPKAKNIVLEVKHLKNIPKWLLLEQGSGVPLLKRLSIRSSQDTLYLVDAMTDHNQLKTFFSSLRDLYIHNMGCLEEILRGPYLANVQAQPCFSHLTEIIIRNCPKLKHVFPLSVAVELAQLQVLHISSCGGLKKIFYEHHAGDGNQKVSRVQFDSPSIETALTPPYSSRQVRFLPIELLNWTPSNVESITEENIAKLDTKEADAMRGTIIFPQLTSLSLNELPELRKFSGGNHAWEFPSLIELQITRCDKIKALSDGSFKAPHLVHIKINDNSYQCGEDLNKILKKTDEDDAKLMKRAGGCEYFLVILIGVCIGILLSMAFHFSF